MWERTYTEDGQPFYQILSGTNEAEQISDRKKLHYVLTNPAVLKVFAIQADLFSLGRLCQKDSQGEKVEASDGLTLLNSPNPFQTGKQFAWDYMFNLMLGSAYCLSTTPGRNSSATRLYFLNTGFIEFPENVLDKLDRRYRSKSNANAISKLKLEYNCRNGKKQYYALEELKVWTDLSNGVSGNWYKGNSRLDALYGIVKNSNAAIAAKNSNLDFAGKFLVSGEESVDNPYADMLGEGEKQAIETVLHSSKQVHAVKSKIAVNRFVESLQRLKLDEAYEADYFTIGSMYNIPEEILGIYLNRGNSLSEADKEKAIARHIGYSLMPKAEDFCQGIAPFIGLQDGHSLEISWEHLPFMEVANREKAETNRQKAETFEILVRNGANPEQVAEMLGFDGLEFNTVSNGD